MSSCVPVAPKAGGLANAVLRRMSESAKTFPFGNPNLSLQVLARSQAFPMWLAKRLMNEMTLPKATAFMHACNTDAPVFIAVNSVKGDFEQIEEAFDQAGSLLDPSEDVQGCYRVKEARSLRSADVRALFELASCSCPTRARKPWRSWPCLPKSPQASLKLAPAVARRPFCSRAPRIAHLAIACL